MGLFSGLEGNLEKYIEGFFKDKFKSRVQPAEIAKQLAREMRNHRRVSISNVYVPNEYHVLLNPEDWEHVGSFNKMLSLELQDYVQHKAEEKGFTLVGQPVVILEKDENIAIGNILVQAEFSEAVPVNPESLRKESIEPDNLDQNTQMYRPLRDTTPMKKIVTSSKLVITEGVDQGKEFSLGTYRTIIGRRETNDIVLTDISVSRRHAQLDHDNGRYVLTDLNSTNGTFVNGQRITKQLLEPGDVITFGTTVCIFKVD